MPGSACGMGPGHASDSTSTTVDTKMACCGCRMLRCVALHVACVGGHLFPGTAQELEGLLEQVKSTLLLRDAEPGHKATCQKAPERAS